MPEGSRYKFEGMQVDQPNAGVGGVDLGNLYASFRGIDRSAWQLQDETIQKDLLAGASPQDGFNRYMQLAQVAGAAGDSLQSVIFQQKAYSLQNAASGGSGGGSGGRRGGSGSEESSSSLKDGLAKLKSEDLPELESVIVAVSEAIKNGSISAPKGFEALTTAVAQYTQNAIELYNANIDKVGKRGFVTDMKALAKEAGIGADSSANTAINKALKEHLYGGTVPDGDYVSQLSYDSGLINSPEGKDMVLAFTPETSDKLNLSTRNASFKTGLFLTTRQKAEEAGLVPVKRMLGDEDESGKIGNETTVYVTEKDGLLNVPTFGKDGTTVTRQLSRAYDDAGNPTGLQENGVPIGDSALFLDKDYSRGDTSFPFASLDINSQAEQAKGPNLLDRLKQPLQEDFGGNVNRGLKALLGPIAGRNPFASEAQAAELPDPFAGVKSGVQGKASRLVDNEMEPLKIQAIKQMNLTPEAEKYAMNIPITSGKLEPIDGKIIDGIFDPGSNEIVIDRGKMKPDAAYGLVGVIQHELLHALQAKFLPKVGKKSDPVSQAVESYFGLKRQDAGFRVPSMLEKNPSTNFGEGIGNNAEEDFAMGNLPLKAYGAIFKTNNRGGFLGENVPPGSDSQPPTPLYNILLNNPNVFQPNSIAPLSQRYSNANPLGRTMGQLNSQLLNRFFPDQQASINQNAEPTNNVFQSIVDTIAKRNQPAKKQGAAYQAPVVQMQETPVSRSSTGLVSKAGGGYSNPFAGAKGGVQGQVSAASQAKTDPLQLRNQASLAALGGFKQFANFLKGIF